MDMSHKVMSCWKVQQHMHMIIIVLEITESKGKNER